ncbi:MAG: hypothetical protein JXR59_08030 [Desulfuromonadaceae bacterium]|nr:hypothetical protein [Desulfuromonadaceae bacterium]
MRKQDVPQDVGVFESESVVNYALDGEGRYCLTPTQGWMPVNEANRLAWEEIQQQLNLVRSQIAAGQLSSLAYYMSRALMDVSLLAQYSGFARWRVKRHLKPGPFSRLNAEQLAVYAWLFGVAPEALRQLPEEDVLPVSLEGESHV